MHIEMYVPYVGYLTPQLEKMDKKNLSEVTKFQEVSLHKKSESKNSLHEKCTQKSEKGSSFSFFSNLFRSKSDSEIEKKKEHYPIAERKKSSKSSPASCPARRRKFVRVVHDDVAQGEEYSNPNITRRYSKNYWEKKNSEALSYSPTLSNSFSGNTILKKQSSTDEVADSPNSKQIYFKAEVDVVFYDKKEKCTGIASSSVSHEKLHDMEKFEKFNTYKCISDNAVNGYELDRNVVKFSADSDSDDEKIEALTVKCSNILSCSSDFDTSDIESSDIDIENTFKMDSIDEEITDETDSFLNYDNLELEVFDDSSNDNQMCNGLEFYNSEREQNDFNDSSTDNVYSYKIGRKLSSDEDGSTKKSKMNDQNAEFLESCIERCS